MKNTSLSRLRWQAGGLFGICFLLLGLMTSCSKDKIGDLADNPEPQHPGVWVIDSTTYFTDSIFVEHDMTPAVRISGTGQGNYFQITFYGDSLPANGTIPLNCSGNEGEACMEVSQGIDLNFRPNSAGSSVLQISRNADSSVLITLPPTWFYNTLDNGQDSIQISGSFQLP